MAVVSAVRWLGLRSRLGQPLTGRRAGLCEQARSCRFYSGSATLSKVEGTDVTGIEEVVIPRKKTWDKVAVLQALASTVNRDTTAVPYVFQDDPYLMPASSLESRSFLLAKKSGENVAKFIINSYPKYFQKDIAEPHIPEPLCLLKQQIVSWIYCVTMVTRSPQLIIIFNKLDSQKHWKRKMMRHLGG
ncbi:PTCD3 isoform 5, partial [Pan troglodytes]